MVGLGSQGQEHLQAAAKAINATFVAGVDFDALARARTLILYPELDGFLFDHSNGLIGLDIDGLVLALPHHVYAKQWKALLSLKLPMLKEKPLARSNAEALKFLSQAHAAGCPLQTAIQRRHHPSYVHCCELIKNSGERITEIHAHLHLGLPRISNLKIKTWRSRRSHSGGGALMDLGYHMVDLLQSVAGPFEWVSSALLAGSDLASAAIIEDRAYLYGRNESTWFSLDSWVHGAPDPEVAGGCIKSEGLSIQTDKNLWLANRSEVRIFGRPEPEFLTERSWSVAMAQQLDEFARRIKTGDWTAPDVWDQLPAMRVIDQAYQQSLHF